MIAILVTDNVLTVNIFQERRIEIELNTPRLRRTHESASPRHCFRLYASRDTTIRPERNYNSREKQLVTKYIAKENGS